MDPNVEFFEGDFGKMAEFVPKELSRRQIVSKRASLYDMLGKISPAIANLKLFEKEVLMCTMGWDDAVPESLRLKAVQNFVILEKLRGVHYNRARIPPDAVSDQARIILLVDAAEKALMLTVYIKFTNFYLQEYTCNTVRVRILGSDRVLVLHHGPYSIPFLSSPFRSPLAFRPGPPLYELC